MASIRDLLNYDCVDPGDVPSSHPVSPGRSSSSDSTASTGVGLHHAVPGTAHDLPQLVPTPFPTHLARPTSLYAPHGHHVTDHPMNRSSPSSLLSPSSGGEDVLDPHGHSPLPPSRHNTPGDYAGMYGYNLQPLVGYHAPSSGFVSGTADPQPTAARTSGPAVRDGVTTWEVEDHRTSYGGAHHQPFANIVEARSISQRPVPAANVSGGGFEGDFYGRPSVDPVVATLPSTPPSDLGSAPHRRNGKSIGGTVSRQAELERNRATSSRFRQNAREEAARVAAELSLVQKEQDMLRKHASELVAQGVLRADTFDGLVAPNIDAVNDYDIFLPQTPATAAILGVDRISEPVARVMVEIIAARRGMFEKPDRNLTAEEVYRRTCSEYDECIGALSFYADGTRVPQELYEARFAELYKVYRNWDRWESSDGPSASSERNCRNDHDGRPPRSSRPLSVKKCRRCHIMKTAGSGHRRSHCPDGVLVSSDIPFPCLASVG